MPLEPITDKRWDEAAEAGSHGSVVDQLRRELAQARQDIYDCACRNADLKLLLYKTNERMGEITREAVRLRKRVRELTRGNPVGKETPNACSIPQEE